MSKREFDYCEFGPDFCVVYDADKYTQEQAIKSYFEEYCCETDSIEDIVVEEDYIKWKPRASKDEMWLFDLEEPRGIYITCDKDDKKAFKVWKVKG